MNGPLFGKGTLMSSPASTANSPVRTFRLKGVKVAVFENPVQNGTLHKVTIQRVYREDQEWKTTASLGRDDLPVATLLLGKAWEFILEAQSSKEATT